MKLDTKIQFMSGVGPVIASKLAKLGIETISDLIFYYPRAYIDFLNITKISDFQNSDVRIQISEGAKITIRGKIVGIANKKTSRRRFTVTEAVVEDGTGSLKVVWFNQPFLLKMLPAGREVILNGKITYNFYTKEVIMESPERTLYPRIEPVYGETAGLTSRYISKLVASAKDLILSVEEYLPKDLLCHSERAGRSEESQRSFESPTQDDKEGDIGDKNNLTVQSPKGGSPFGGQFNNKLLGIQEALLNIHFPKNREMLEKARRRIAFDELFMISLRSNLSKEEIKTEKGPVINIPDEKIASFVRTLPFELTEDQKKSTWQIIQDMKEDKPMNRLLNGDVGSGKTVVAAIASMVVVKAGYRVAFMCPTSILASQHYITFRKLFKDQGISVGLFTRERKDNFQFKISNLKSISNDKIIKINKKTTDNLPLTCDIVIGTQALIQKDVNVDNLGLVIVDEQHRFGVAQRAALQKLISAENSPAKIRSHFLSMTATPIPRTMHLALFGDLDFSVIREKPAERKEIKTKFVSEVNRQKAYQFIGRQIEAGRQAFVICPLIEQNTDNSKQMTELFEEERKTVKVEFEKLQKIFPEYKIGMLHGKMKGKEKDGVMEEFCANRLNIIVSTSVVEVGVDVPNASVMMIEDAERFGLAQIHQFRGRVGRAEHQSYCFLFSSTRSQKALDRLQSLEMISDGFKLAEIDLETRGPGSVFGTEQSGMLDLKMASFSDRELILEASEAAKSIIEIDPKLTNHPILKEKISEYLVNKHLE